MTIVNDHLNHVKIIFKGYILEYEKDEVASKNLAENGENEIRDLNRRTSHLKIEERKFEREDEEIWKR